MRRGLIDFILSPIRNDGWQHDTFCRIGVLEESEGAGAIKVVKEDD
jgi:hypothetical protein